MLIEKYIKGHKMTTDFQTLIPEGLLFSIKDIDAMKLIKKDMLRKIILNNGIAVVKIGSKNFIDRQTLINYLESCVIPAAN